jgi:hypothetical protein
MFPREAPATARRAVTLVATIALLVAACGSPQPSASPTAIPPSPTAAPASPGVASPTPDGDPNEALYAQIEAQVAALRELEPTGPVSRTVLDEDGLRAHVRTILDRELGTPEAAAGERLLKALGLIPRDASIRALYEETLASQIAGQYDPDEQRMYIISRTGRIGPNEQITYAHEFVHALQDQHFDLRAFIGEETDQSDRQAARSALVEGDATLLMTYWAQAHLTPQELAEVIGSVDPDAQAILDRMPRIISESLLFPYQAGLNLVFAEQLAGGWDAVNAMFADPPASTEQVLHPEKYRAREAPAVVTFPDDLAARLGDGWTVGAQDTLGEFVIELWLRDVGGLNRQVTQPAAAGWGGDRVALVEGPDAAWAVALQLAWDTTADAGEFADAAEAAVVALRNAGSAAQILRPQPGQVVVVIGSTPDAMGRLANVLGLAG